MLSEIAYDSFQQNQLFFSKDDVTDRITAFLTDTLDAPKHLNADAVLLAIEVQQGILVERAVNTYSFSHLTLQEYLTARHIVENHLEEDTITQHLTDDSWREVFLLVSGLMKNRALQLFKGMDCQARMYLRNHPRLKALVSDCSKSDTGASDLYRRAATVSGISRFISDVGDVETDDLDRASRIARIMARATAKADNIAQDANVEKAKISAREKATYIAKQSDIARDLNVDQDIAIAKVSDMARAIVIAIDYHPLNVHELETITVELSNLCQRQQMITRRNRETRQKPAFHLWQKFTTQLQLVWLNVLNLDAESIVLSVEESEAWRNYVYSNELLIQCKKAAVRVSRSEWEEIESRLLTLDEVS